MISKSVTIINVTGLHARPASEFVGKAKTFASKITIRNVTANHPAVNAKSIMRILGEGLSKGTLVEISADGEDESRAVEELVALIESGFGE